MLANNRFYSILDALLYVQMVKIASSPAGKNILIGYMISNYGERSRAFELDVVRDLPRRDDRRHIVPVEINDSIKPI